MPEIINPINSDQNCITNNLNHEFLLVENVFSIKKIKQEIKLCIIKTDFTKAELKHIKRLKTTNQNAEVWICSNYPSKENIISANKIGIKTIISSPIDNKMVEEFFIKERGIITNRKTDLDLDYSGIAGSKVMIVDDNPMNVELLEEILSKFDLKISSFLKPKEACEAMLHENFDLFLLDVMMPEMSGFELAKKIKDCTNNKNVPIIFISALSDTHNKMKGYHLGSFAYIEKPFDINLIKTQIYNILKNKRAQEMVTSDKENFLATIAHDLKTPINAGINALNLLLDNNLGELEDDQQEIISDILNSTKFMKDMVENILCKNKIEGDRINLAKNIYSLKELVEHCIEITKYITIPRKQKIQFKCNISETLVEMDFLEIKRAVHNLIANASEYSPEGGKILIEVFENGTDIGFYVKDYGKGIDLVNQQDVFLQYMTFAKKYKKVGSGLGLYITKRIIEAHNGKINLESELNEGTKITVTLPAYKK